MRVLWIAPNGGNYKNNVVKGTGGWIGALQEELTEKDPDLNLGISFPSSDDKEVREGNVTYYPIKVNESEGFIHHIRYLLSYDRMKLANKLKEGMLKIIDNFNPDVVHVWGLENMYAILIPEIKCPFVVHIQGFMTPIYTSYFSPGFSLLNLKKMDSVLNPLNWGYRLLNLSQIGLYKGYKTRSEIEIRVSPYIKYWMGRTEWDKEISKILSPNSVYFHCDEMIRSDFVDCKWSYHYNGTIHIQSSISQYWYKGIDVILKTADTLKKLGIKFEWNVYGIKPKHRLVNYFERSLGIKADSVNIVFHGYVDAATIRNSLLKSDMYFHPSNIENSSNAIAEAMMLGVPTIAQFVGGNPSMLKEDSGILVSQGEPYIICAAILKMIDENVARHYSEKALDVSRRRQNSETIVKDLLNIYSIVAGDKAID